MELGNVADIQQPVVTEKGLETSGAVYSRVSKQADFAAIQTIKTRKSETYVGIVTQVEPVGSVNICNSVGARPKKR